MSVDFAWISSVIQSDVAYKTLSFTLDKSPFAILDRTPLKSLSVKRFILL